MKFIKEKGRVLIFILTCVILFIGMMFYSIYIYIPTGLEGGDFKSALFFTNFFLSPIYAITALQLLFFKEKLLARWFIYSLIYTLPIVYMTSSVALSGHDLGIGAGIFFIAIGIFAILLFITTPFFLHWQSKKIRNRRK